MFCRATLSRLQVLEHLFKVAANNLLAITCLLDPAVFDQLIVLPNPFRNSVLPNTACSVAQFLAGLLPIAPHTASSLLDVPFEPGHLIGKSLFSLAKLLSLLLRSGRTLVFRKLIHASRNLVLPLDRFFGLLPKLLHILLTARALR